MPLRLPVPAWLLLPALAALATLATLAGCDSHADNVCSDIGDCAQGGSYLFVEACQTQAQDSVERGERLGLRRALRRLLRLRRRELRLHRHHADLRRLRRQARRPGGLPREGGGEERLRHARRGAGRLPGRRRRRCSRRRGIERHARPALLHRRGLSGALLSHERRERLRPPARRARRVLAVRVSVHLLSAARGHREAAVHVHRPREPLIDSAPGRARSAPPAPRCARRDRAPASQQRPRRGR